MDTRRRWWARVGSRSVPYLAALTIFFASLQVGVPAGASQGFWDIGRARFHTPAVSILDHIGIIDGTECDEGRFCPDGFMNRWVMAVWIYRALGLDEPEEEESGTFSDVGASWWSGHVNRLTESGITVGCDEGSTMYCPYRVVTRGQMASFLVRAFEIPSADSSVFTDTGGDVHAENIEALAAHGITGGCATDPDRYCPNAPVTRGQMATMLARVLGLVPPARFSDAVETHSIGHLVSQFTTYYRCCQNRVVNIHRFADKLTGAVVAPKESFSLNRYIGIRTSADGFRAAGTLIRGRLVNTVGGGVSQAATTFYNAMFWGGYQSVSHKPHSIYFPRYPEGIEATINWPDIDLVFRNDTSDHILIVASYTPTSLTIAFYGNNDGRVLVGDWEDGEGAMTVVSEGGAGARVVSATVSERYRWRSPPAPLVRTDSNLGFDERRVVQTAQVGWSVKVTRTVEVRGSASTQDWTVRYVPRQRIVVVHPCTLTDSCTVPDEEGTVEEEDPVPEEVGEELPVSPI